MKSALSLKRIIIFTRNVSSLIEFYLGLLDKPESYIDQDGKWGEILCGETSIAFHLGKKRGSNEHLFKLVFYSDGIAKKREELMKRGYRTGKISRSGRLMFFDVKDPDGNFIQFSNRN
ncbi:MAG: hypothetical protein ABI543_08620 [Ignavibacteria bacterium]